jgi:hypothetical protein
MKNKDGKAAKVFWLIAIMLGFVLVWIAVAILAPHH